MRAHSTSHLGAEIAVAAARLVADEGMEYGQAKRKAARALGRHVRSSDLPGNEAVENEVRAHIALFQSETQAAELAALRGLALRWMLRLSPFRPHVSGAVWRGTANRHSMLRIDLYCDDPKSAEIGLINLEARFDAGLISDERGAEFTVLSLAERCHGMPDPVTLHLSVRDHDDLRGALKPDSSGRSWRGDTASLQRLIAQPPAQVDASPRQPTEPASQVGSGQSLPHASTP